MPKPKSVKSKPEASKVPAKRGRPSKIDPVVTAAICANLELAMPLKLAAEAEGVAERTIHDWIERDPEFSASITRAKAKAVKNLTVRSLSGGKGSHAANFFLERRFRDHYGNVSKIEHAGHDGGSVKIESKAIAQMSDEELLKLAGS